MAAALEQCIEISPNQWQWITSGGTTINLRFGSASEKCGLAAQFRQGQFDSFPDGILRAMLSLLKKSALPVKEQVPAEQSVNWTLVVLDEMQSEVLLWKSERMPKYGDMEFVWGCTACNSLVSELLWCSPTLILRSDPYHRPRTDKDPVSDAFLICRQGTSGSSDVELVIDTTLLDIDVETHRNLLFMRLLELPQSWRIAFATVLGTADLKSALEMFGVQIEQLKKPRFSCKHLEASVKKARTTLRFYLTTLSALNGADVGDDVEFRELRSTPFMTGDHLAAKSDRKGFLDLAAEFALADLVWISDQLVLRGPPYLWCNQYLNEVDSDKKVRPRLNALMREFLDNGSDPSWDDVPLTQIRRVRERSKAENWTVPYILTGEKALHSVTGLVPRGPLLPVGDATTGPGLRGTLEGGRSKDLLIKPGMGVAVLDPARTRKLFMGLVVAISPGDSEEGRGLEVVVRPVLGRENIPPCTLNLEAHEVLQTNLVLRVDATCVVGTFSLLPAALFHSGCEAPADHGKRKIGGINVSVVRDKTVVGHAEVLGLPNSQDGGLQYQEIEILDQVQDGSAGFKVWRVSPADPARCLFLLASASRLFGAMGRTLQCYCDELEALLYQFAKSKTSASLTVSENTFKVHFPGRLLMEIVHTYVERADLSVALENGVMAVTVSRPSALRPIFQQSIEVYDFTSDCKGKVEIYGPFAFKWAMYDDVQPDGRVGRTEGYASVTVGGWKEFNRMGQLIKSSEDSKKSRSELKRAPMKKQ
jgi:hypothetical protein